MLAATDAEIMNPNRPPLPRLKARRIPDVQTDVPDDPVKKELHSEGEQFSDGKEKKKEKKKKKKKTRRGQKERSQRAPATEARRERRRTDVALQEASRPCGCPPYLPHNTECKDKNLNLPPLLLGKLYDYDAIRERTAQIRINLDLAERIDAKLCKKALRQTATTGGDSVIVPDPGTTKIFSLKLDRQTYLNYTDDRTYRSLDNFAVYSILQDITAGHSRTDIDIHKVRLFDCFGQDVHDIRACYDKVLWPVQAQYQRTTERYRAGNESWLCDSSASSFQLRLQDTLTKLSWLTKDFRVLDKLWSQLESLSSLCTASLDERRWSPPDPNG